MTNRFTVAGPDELKELPPPDTIRQPGVIKFFAYAFSYFFHPLFIPVYITLFLLLAYPHLFAGLDDWGKLGNLLQIFVNCTFLPLVSVLLLKGLKFIDSVFLKTQKERIVPYMISMIFYFWNWYAFKNNHGAPEMQSLSMAVFNASVFGFLANITLKVSMHAMAMGVMSTFIVLLAFKDTTNASLYLSVGFLITGIVCTSRFIVSDHSSREVYAGLFIGILSQLAAHYFVGGNNL